MCRSPFVTGALPAKEKRIKPPSGGFFVSGREGRAEPKEPDALGPRFGAAHAEIRERASAKAEKDTPGPQAVRPQAGSELGGRGIGQQAGFSHLQIVVAREIDDKVPGHGLVALQVAVHHHTFHAIERGGNAPGRVAQMAARARSAGAETELL